MPKGTFCAYVPFGLLQIFKRKMHGNSEIDTIRLYTRIKQIAEIRLMKACDDEEKNGMHPSYIQLCEFAQRNSLSNINKA